MRHPIPFGEVSRVMALTRDTIRLDLLADIDATIDTLTVLAQTFHRINAEVSGLEAHVSSFPVRPGEYFDPDYQYISRCEDAEAALKSFLPRMIAKRAAIDGDGRLTTEHRESLHDAYEEAMTSAAVLHEAIQAARHAILGYDMAAEPWDASPTFDTVEELIADLHK